MSELQFEEHLHRSLHSAFFSQPLRYLSRAMKTRKEAAGHVLGTRRFPRSGSDHEYMACLPQHSSVCRAQGYSLPDLSVCCLSVQPAVFRSDSDYQHMHSVRPKAADRYMHFDCSQTDSSAHTGRSVPAALQIGAAPRNTDPLHTFDRHIRWQMRKTVERQYTRSD